MKIITYKEALDFITNNQKVYVDVSSFTPHKGILISTKDLSNGYSGLKIKLEGVEGIFSTISIADKALGNLIFYTNCSLLEEIRNLIKLNLEEHYMIYVKEICINTNLLSLFQEQDPKGIALSNFIYDFKEKFKIDLDISKHQTIEQLICLIEQGE